MLWPIAVLLVAVIGLIGVVLIRLREQAQELRRLREQITVVHAVALELRDRPASFVPVNGGGSGAFQPVNIEAQGPGGSALTVHKTPQPEAVISTTEVERLAKDFLKT